MKRRLLADMSWHPFADVDGVVHHAARLPRKEAEYLFRLAEMVTVLVPCGYCGAARGKSCRRKDGQKMCNHSMRVTHARRVVQNEWAPLFGRLFQPLCAFDGGGTFVVFESADGRDIDCMACLARGRPVD